MFGRPDPWLRMLGKDEYGRLLMTPLDKPGLDAVCRWCGRLLAHHHGAMFCDVCDPHVRQAIAA